MLEFFAVGIYGEAELYAGESIQEVSQLLCQGCQRKGIGIEIQSKNRGTVFFRIIDNQQTKMEL